MTKKILITGGAGYIGSHTAIELIEEGHTPVIVDNFSNSKRWVIDRIERITGKRPAVYEGDVRDADFMSRVFESEPGIEGVIHFAALKAVGESVKHPLAYYDNNLRSLLVLLGVMERYGVRHIVFSSSATVYGSPKQNPIKEEDEVREASSPYGSTKIVAETILRDVYRSGAPLGIVSLRYFNPIGAHPSGLLGELPIGTPNNLVPFITQVAAGIRERLTVFGADYDTEDGTCVRDYIHVTDLARAHIATLAFLEAQETPYHGVFNVGTGSGTSVKELLALFEKVSGVEVNHEIGERREGDIAVCYAENIKITTMLDWRPRYGIEDALRHSWEWQKSLGEEK